MYVHGLLLSEGVNKIPIYAVNIFKKAIRFFSHLKYTPRSCRYEQEPQCP